MHNIQPNAKHAIVSILVAMPATGYDTPSEIADGLNELLRTAVHDEHIADYKLVNVHKPVVAKADNKPEEGSLFEKMRSYMVCVVDTDHNEEWIRVDTELDLADMNEVELKAVLKGVVIIGEDDSISVSDIDSCQRVTI